MSTNRCASACAGPGANQRVAHSEDAAEAPELRATKAHILLVDDDPFILDLCRRYLIGTESLGPPEVTLEILTATSGGQALETAQRLAGEGERIACALVDFAIDESADGIEIVGRLWGLDPDVQCTLVTGVGSSIEDEIRERVPGTFLDRWDYLAKPFTEFEIVQRVRRALCTWCAHRGEEQRRGEYLVLLSRLNQANRELEAKVRRRTEALADRNSELEANNERLEQALHDLATAQSQLLQQEKMACIGQLSAGVAHELNNPIGFVHSNLGTLRNYGNKLRGLIDAYEARVGDGDEELNALKAELKTDFVLEDLPVLVEESLEGTERVRRIVSDLKVFSHPAELEAAYSDLNEGLSSTLNIVHNEIKYKAQVITDFGEIPPVRCRASAINQVFMNLLVNAAQAIEKAGEIRVATRREGDFVVVTISDSGSGMPAGMVKRVFEPFFTTKEVGKGTGLGLSISYDIVRKHGGSISAESEVGQGTTFTVRLPVDGKRNLKEAS